MRKKLVDRVSKKLDITTKASGNGKIKKQYLKSRPVCKVTFRLPREAAPAATRAHIAGDFNNWDQEFTLMKRSKDGNFTVTIELEKGKEYRFRYLIDDKTWENDWHADKYVPNPFGGDDSVVIV
jgi:1,4-alpha-glucan branching enzyme